MKRQEKQGGRVSGRKALDAADIGRHLLSAGADITEPGASCLSEREVVHRCRLIHRAPWGRFNR